MQTLKFKTDLKCAGCMYAIKPYMDAIEDIESWDADLSSAETIVEVVAKSGSKEKIQEAVEQAISRAGYSAVLVN